MLDVADRPTWVWLLAIAVGVVGTARLTRLIVFDEWPPTKAIRDWWIGRTSHVWDNGTVVPGPWQKLLTCAFCAAPWFMVVCFAWALATDFHWTWWLFYGWLAASYLASIVVAYDEGVTE